MSFPTGPGWHPFFNGGYAGYLPPPPPPPPRSPPPPPHSSYYNDDPPIISTLPIGRVYDALPIDSEMKVEEALKILQLDPGADHSVLWLLRAFARMHNAACLVTLLRLGEIIEKPHHPCQHQSRAKTLEDVINRIDTLKRLAEHYGSCCDPGTLAAASAKYESLCNMEGLPIRPELHNLRYYTPAFLHSAAEALWSQWPAGWRLYWMEGVEPILAHQSPGEVGFWALKLVSLLRKQPHPVLQIALRRLRGQHVEREAWWVNRKGLVGAALDRITPDTEFAVMTVLKSEGKLYGM
ncbi:hypothetical protein NLG97_g8756 [Lecanicillium saksenae]|uniref:Uncharacterized protein n=1 Tax=Lecanicillium saksenae TaxID=468837 RepID=A0ACC1QLB0_9HYPO|nr:hypothetical protein NLG97_g8756 [Lecanicillium saksenae]